MELDDFAPTPDDGELRTLSGMANQLITLREEIERHSSILKQLSAEERQLSQHDLPEKMKEIGLTNFTMSDGTKLSIKHMVKASLTKAKQEEGFAWLRANGFGDLIKPKTVEEHVHHSTLAAFCREQLSEGRPLPTSLFGVYEYDETIIK